ncbi:DNA N-6-adenine-methyltransferase [Magnetospira sp. QH-2]|uniref:DNA N-6-adenine-methyltransferase n=1 Tax=Magnetospira sp. (strain QH-2) TaxID=1288970 RepID=UPI0003E8164B|nr:DNA N-6-adenine-methyltransferase [Magnetospira sp. QH-2]CCQ72778.1 Conserved protein of unknown function [Magnetospira sp. QH-2]
MLVRLHDTCSSSLRNAGGDYRTADLKVNLRPTVVTEFREAFGGGASMTFTMIRRGLAERFWWNDLDPHLVNFWTMVRDRADDLVGRLHAIRGEHGLGSEDLFKLAESMVGSDDAIEAAAGFWVRNRLDYGGTNGKSGYNPSYVREGRGVKKHFIDNILGFSELLQGVKITNLDYRDVLAEPGDGVLNYADPPFEDVGPTMYPFGEEDLEELSALVRNCSHDCLVKVNDSPANRLRFADMKPILRTYHSSMGEHSEKAELLAANYDAPLYSVYARQIGEPLFDLEAPANDNIRELPKSVPVGEDTQKLFLDPKRGKRNPEWYTPDWILDHLYAANGDQPFDIDPCSPIKGPQAPVWANRHYTVEDDGLTQPWQGRMFINPPFNDLKPWLKKAAESTWCGEFPNAPTRDAARCKAPACESIVGLIPARQHNRYWQHYVAYHAKVWFFHGKVKFRKGRIGDLQTAKTAFPEGLALVIWGNHRPFTDYFNSALPGMLHVADRSHPTIPDIPIKHHWSKITTRPSVVTPVEWLIEADEFRRIGVKRKATKPAMKEAA